MAGFYSGNVEEDAFQPIYEQAVNEINKVLEEVKIEAVGAEGSADRAATSAIVSTNAAKDATDTLAAVKVIEKNVNDNAILVDTIKQEVLASEANAEASENAAKISETNAKASEVAAKISETNAKASESTVNASAEAAKISETNAKASEVAAKQSENIAVDAKDKSVEIYEAFLKGSVYRGGWNPKTEAYPDPLGVNSQWDVYLDKGVDVYEWNGDKWYSGDRLIYSVPDSRYFHITRVAGVLSVNGHIGSVILTSDDVGAYNKAETDAKDNTRVPTTRKVNNKPLTSDISLNANDINVANPNLLINGDFSVWQRGTYFKPFVGGLYTTDRWKSYYLSGSNVNSGDWKPKVGDWGKLTSGLNHVWDNDANIYTEQVIEKGVNLTWGETVTFSAYVYVSDLSLLSNMFFDLRSEDGVIDTTEVDILSQIPTGGNFHFVTGTMKLPESAHVSVVEEHLSVRIFMEGLAGCNLFITHCKLELGSVATPFVADDPQVNLAKCQRYYRKLKGWPVYGVSYDISTNSKMSYIPFDIPMRTAPTLVAVWFGGKEANLVKLDVSGCRLIWTEDSTSTKGWVSLDFSSEL